MRSSMRVGVLLASFLSWTSLTLATESWPQFRGPDGDGVAPDAKVPQVIDRSVIKWETDIHGKGWSSPVVWGNQVWLTTATEDGTEMSVICIDRDTGTVIHDQIVQTNKSPRFCHSYNSYASCTPVIERGRIYVHFGSYLTACLDTETANVIWKRQDLVCDHFRGPASSPILHNGKLLVSLDGVDARYVIALDKQTGKTVWRTDREIDYGTDNPDRMKAYGTGHVIQVGGQAQFVAPSAVETIAYDPERGQPLWRVIHGGMNASARPLLRDGQLFLSNGSGKWVAVRPQAVTQSTPIEIETDWISGKAASKKASAIFWDGLLYMNTDDGILSARHADSGDVVWKKRIGGSFAASPVFAGGHIYFFSTSGEIVVICPGEKFDPVSQTKLGDGFMGSPAIVGDEIILRSKSKLYCAVSKR